MNLDQVKFTHNIFHFMKISYNWLQNYFEKKLPEPEKVAEGIIFHSFEVEEIEKVGKDTVFEIKVLPDRAHDCLSHFGIAKEISAIFELKLKERKYEVPKSKPTNLKIEITTKKDRRHMGRIVRNIKVGPSPQWVVDCLTSMGQRSINNIVDVTNIIMFDCGQPTHSFDLNKVKGPKLNIKDAKNGQKITLLTGEEKELNDTMIVICDEAGNPLDTGMKGGKHAEITISTTDIILEADNFDPVFIRKTGQALNIMTDARKRFENDLSPELIPYAMQELSALIHEMCPEAVFEDIVDTYPIKQKQNTVFVSVDYINKRLGTDFSKKEIENVWERLGFEYEEENGEFKILVPLLRLDIEGPHDLTEDVIKILGYERIKGKLPEINQISKINENFYKILWARNKLLNEGYSEVMTYSFRDKGEVEVLASASDKKFLRTNLTDGLKESLKLNQLNAPLLEMDDVKIFEIGTIFKKNREEMSVAYDDKKGIKEISLDEFCKNINFSAETFLHGLAGVGDPGNRGSEKKIPPMKFKQWSIYPFIARDIAVWVPEGIRSDEVYKVIKENAGNMVVRGPNLFDEFKKDGKKSYAFRLVFQSYERTLLDTEVNEIMTKITNKIKAQNDWQVR
jgi:phenylalanyl-tRNA synthetase beta chain